MSSNPESDVDIDIDLEKANYDTFPPKDPGTSHISQPTKPHLLYTVETPNQHQKRKQRLILRQRIKIQHHLPPPSQKTDIFAPCPGPAPAAPLPNPSPNPSTDVSSLRMDRYAGVVMVEPMYGCRLR